MNKLLHTYMISILTTLLIALVSQTAIGATYYHHNLQGSTAAATDEAGNVLWTENYRPYGERTDNPATDNDVWYTGHSEDTDTGLTYTGARWYDPVLGRFMGIDPVGINLENLHTINRYAYANNNPYKFVDPDGRLPVLVPLAIWVLDALAVGGAGLTGYKIGSVISDVSRGESSVSEALSEHGPGIALGLAGGGVAKLGGKVVTGAVAKGGNGPPIHSRYKDGTPVYEGQQPGKVKGSISDSPHSVIKNDAVNNRIYKARTYDGNGVPVKDIDFTHPTFPNGTLRPNHTVPEQHLYIQNIPGNSRSGYKRGPGTPLEYP